MKGLKPGWEGLPRVSIRFCATSASGPERDEVICAIPLLSALCAWPQHHLIVACEDGLTLMLPAADAAGAYLAPLSGGGWQLVLPMDTTRRRWVKNVISFVCM